MNNNNFHRSVLAPSVTELAIWLLPTPNWPIKLPIRKPTNIIMPRIIDSIKLPLQLSIRTSIITKNPLAVSSCFSTAFLCAQQSFSLPFSCCAYCSSSFNMRLRFNSFSSSWRRTLMTRWNLNRSTRWACCRGVNRYLFLTNTLIPCFSQRYLMYREALPWPIAA